MEKFLNDLTRQLERFPGLEKVRTEDSITVQPSDPKGFSVTIYGESDNYFVVNYGHYWHGHFEVAEEAADWFLAGVIGKARLVCTYRWRYLVKTIVEASESGQWIKADTLGSCLSVIVWWLPKRTEIFLNDFRKE
jgi:hypothetical protein